MAFRPAWLKKLLEETDEPICPEVQSACIKHRCVRYVHVTGKNPQSGADMDYWDCTFNWLPALLLENSKVQRETGAAVESFRNEMVQTNAVALMLANQPLHSSLGGPLLGVTREAE